MRTFLAVEIPEQVRRKVDRFINEEKKNRLPIKWIKIDNLHITLKFLGEIDEKKQQEILSVLEDISESKPSFQMDLEGVGCFPHLSLAHLGSKSKNGFMDT
jgi:2'-5' RNA ligase